MNNTTCPYCNRADCKLQRARLAKTGVGADLFDRSTGDIRYSMKHNVTAENASNPVMLETPFTAEQIGKLEALYLGASSPRLSSYRDLIAPQDLTLEAPVDTSWLLTEKPIECAGGLLEPSTDHWFSLENQESRLANGLVRPDAFPDEQVAQLRELMLSRPAPKQPSRKLSLEQLQPLGFPPEEPVSMSAHLETKGGLYAPDF